MARASFDIQIRNEAGRYRFSLSLLKRSAAKILEALGWRKAGLNILLSDDARIRKVNRIYLSHDRPTDVIAFGDLGTFKTIAEPSHLGDIIISLQTAKRNAREYGTTYIYEVHLYLCHGILHLMGYRDKNKRDRDKMWAKQDKVLEEIGIVK